MPIHRTREQQERLAEDNRREHRQTPARLAKPEAPRPHDCYLGKPVNNIAKGVSGDVDIYAANESTVLSTKSCKALGAAVTAGKWVIVSKIRGKFYVGPWER